jgi:hypothetical protein
MKTCTKCKNTWDLTGFHKDSTKKDGMASICKQCYRIRQRTDAAFRERSKLYNRNKYQTDAGYRKRVNETGRRCALRRLYGITVEQYNRMVIDQSGCCAVCRRTLLELGRSLAVDHCHKTGKVRGLLCGGCNGILGRFNDDAERFLRASEYLKRA